MDVDGKIGGDDSNMIRKKANRNTFELKIFFFFCFHEWQNKCFRATKQLLNTHSVVAKKKRRKSSTEKNYIKLYKHSSKLVLYSTPQACTYSCYDAFKKEIINKIQIRWAPGSGMSSLVFLFFERKTIIMKTHVKKKKKRKINIKACCFNQDVLNKRNSLNMVKGKQITSKCMYASVHRHRHWKELKWIYNIWQTLQSSPKEVLFKFWIWHFSKNKRFQMKALFLFALSFLFVCSSCIKSQEQMQQSII